MDNLIITEERKKKKQKKSDRIMGSCPELGPDMIYEVCLRLPIKNLYKFMCISKAWRSIIRHPDFPQAYNRHHPGALFIVQKDSIHYSMLGRRLQEVEEKFVRLPLPNIDGGRITNVVNGLFCFHNSETVSVCHVWTREIMRLPSPDTSISDGLCRFYFGFDPVNRAYKLLKVTRTRYAQSQWEIHTLGTCSWREIKINVSLRMKVDYEFSAETCEDILVNGVLFIWQESIRSFSFIEEKFRCLKSPFDGHRYGQMAQNSGKFSICYESSFHIITLRVLNQNNNGYFYWTKQNASLPDELQCGGMYWRKMVPVGNLPTGEMLLADGYSRGLKFMSIYSYDHEKNRFIERFVVGELPESVNLKIHCQDLAYTSVQELNFRTLDDMVREG